MDGWLEWFEERCAILEFDAGMSQGEAQAQMAHTAYYLMKQTGERPADLLESRYAHFFLGLVYMGVRAGRDVEVVEYRWRIRDMGFERLYRNWATDEEAHALFGERWHERVDETRRVGKRAVY
jgi:hypothetical protein